MNVVDTNGCQTIDSVYIHVNSCDTLVDLPTGISPNGDGYNDVWIPLGSAVEPDDFNLQVFDRWGEVVFETTDWQEGWDGTYKGSIVPIGVYAYRIAYRNGLTQEKFELIGHLTAIR